MNLLQSIVPERLGDRNHALCARKVWPVLELIEP
jgi:hypothetical protein